MAHQGSTAGDRRERTAPKGLTEQHGPGEGLGELQEGERAITRIGSCRASKVDGNCLQLRDRDGIVVGGGMADSGIENPSSSSPVHSVASVALSPMPPAGECSNPICVEKKRNLIEENDKLLETVRFLSLHASDGRIHSSCPRIGGRHNEHSTGERGSRSRKDSGCGKTERSSPGGGHEIRRNSRCRNARQQAAGQQFIRMKISQAEKEGLTKAINFMEERLQAYRDTILDHDLVLRDESTSEWRHGFKDSRYTLCVSKRTQTTLTSEELAQNENEFKSVQEQLQVWSS